MAVCGAPFRLHAVSPVQATTVSGALAHAQGVHEALVERESRRAARSQSRMAAEEEWRRPRASVAQARPLAHEVFGFSAAADPSAAQQLVSYDDQNVLLQGQDAQGSHCRVVLKIHNRASLACLDQLEAQNEAMLLIQRAGIPCSNPVRCCDAAVARGGCSAHVAVRPLPPAAQDAQAELQHSEEFPVRMLTYIPGDLLRDVPLVSRRGPAFRAASAPPGT